MVELFWDFGEFINLFAVIFPQALHWKALLIEFSDLNLVVLGIEKLSFLFFQLYP